MEFRKMRFLYLLVNAICIMVEAFEYTGKCIYCFKYVHHASIILTLCNATPLGKFAFICMLLCIV